MSLAGWRGTTAWGNLEGDMDELEQSVGISMGADFSWKEYKPPAFPGMENLDRISKAKIKFPGFPNTERALKKSVRMPRAISMTPIKGAKIKWTPVKPFPAMKIPEVEALSRTIDAESKKVENKLAAVKKTVRKVMTKRFKSLPGFKLEIGRGRAIVNKLAYNFRAANEIFENVQKAILQSLDAIGVSIDGAGKIASATKTAIGALPARIKEITGKIAKTMNDNAKQLINDIGKQANAIAKAITDMLTKEIGRYVKELTTNMGNFLKGVASAIQKDIEAMIKTVSEHVMKLSKAVGKDFNAVKVWLEKSLGGIQKNVTENATKMGRKITEDVKAQIKGFEKKITDLSKKITKTIDTKIKFVTSEVNKSLKRARNEMTKIVNKAKADVTKALDETKAALDKRVEEITEVVEGIKAQIDEAAESVRAQAETVKEVKEDIAHTADIISEQAETIKEQAETVAKTTQEILDVRDELREVSDRVSKIEMKPPSIPKPTYPAPEPTAPAPAPPPAEKPTFKFWGNVDRSRRRGKPRTDAERKVIHKKIYGTEKLPPRGTGLKDTFDASFDGDSLGDELDKFVKFMRGKGKPKTDAERRKIHKRIYDTDKLPPRGTRLKDKEFDISIS